MRPFAVFVIAAWNHLRRQMMAFALPRYTRFAADDATAPVKTRVRGLVFAAVLCGVVADARPALLLRNFWVYTSLLVNLVLHMPFCSLRADIERGALLADLCTLPGALLTVALSKLRTRDAAGLAACGVFLNAIVRAVHPVRGAANIALQTVNFVCAVSAAAHLGLTPQQQTFFAQCTLGGLCFVARHVSHTTPFVGTVTMQTAAKRPWVGWGSLYDVCHLCAAGGAAQWLGVFPW